jgi:protein-disulfide isomerase
MKRRLLFVTIGVAALASAASAAAHAHHGSAPAHHASVPSATDWTRVVTATPEGGFRMGNPNASVKLVEYGSITCPHCALLATEGSAALQQQYVKTGRVSWEYRPYMIFPTDPGLFMLLRCQGPSSFFLTTDRLYADQRKWAGKLQSLPRERIRQLQAMAPKARIAALVEATGTAAYFRGLSPARIKACLADERSLNQLIAMTEQASKAGVASTPTLLINGGKAEAGEWAELEPLLKAAGG